MKEHYASKTLNIAKIVKEISASAISVELEHITSNVDDSTIFFENDLTEADLTILESIVSSHTLEEILTQKELDFDKYKKRASVKDDIIATMASDNMERVRTGVWTVSQLIGLTQDAELKLILDDVSTLSYELAVGKIQAATNVLLTETVKNEWIAMLVTHFYN